MTNLRDQLLTLGKERKDLRSSLSKVIATLDKESGIRPDRVKSEFEKIAKQPLTIEMMGSMAYAYGSELAVLRLFHAYNNQARNVKTKMGFSKNQNSWYFSLETAF